MRKTAILMVAVLAGAATAADSQDGDVLVVKGRGAEGKPPYDGGGAVRFLDASINAQLVHSNGDQRIAMPLGLRYEVLEPAPIALTSRMGTEYWRLYNFEAETMTAMYADENIDLARPGHETAEATQAWFGTRYGPAPSQGLVGIRGHYYFLIDGREGQWIDTTDPPLFFDRREIVRKLTFTLADLTQFSLSIPEIQSTWKPGGPFRVRLTVAGADGKTLPVVNAPLVARADSWQTDLATEWAPLDEPTGWMRGELPQKVPDRINLRGTVTAQTPQGLRPFEVAAEFRRGDGQVSAEALQIDRQGYQLARDAGGTIRETRAIWVSPSDIATDEHISTLVGRCKQARLNTILCDIFVRNAFWARSDLIPTTAALEPGFDPLECLIEKAHAAGLEVHPWFCVTYRDRHFRSWFREQYGTEVDMVDQTGAPIALGADVHRPEYRAFVVDLMVGVARDYEVDGIHLDYIRTMGRCFCNDCRSEFAGEFGTSLAEASDEQSITWHRRAIGDIVRRTAEGVRAVRPGAKMSAAVFSDMQSGASQGQDPADWARKGWIDLILPMDYQMQSLQVRANERRFLAAIDDDSKLVTGLSLYMRSGSEVAARPPELVREQIELVRRMGIRGYCLFAYGHLSEDQLDTIREHVNAESAVPCFR
jgi:uncharacterized lipoprotein YddW (UPF0748 family)